MCRKFSNVLLFKALYFQHVYFVSKGKVACEIKQQELLITELIFENVMEDMHYTEIAALLSCVVFEQKSCTPPNLSPSLKQVSLCCIFSCSITNFEGEYERFN